MLAMLALCSTARAADGATNVSKETTPAYGIGRVVDRNGHPEFDVDGKPFFMFGAAFFYDRLPESSWDASMQQIHDLGFNTLDLYVPWNWHERADGDFDFDGRSNPRRNLRELLRLAKAHGFYLIVRPGPVIRNEWRNGGYPQWLLERPEYHMPLRDVLEGRYPATATLQNARSDDAAAEWMQNATHMRYSQRWLRHALHEFDPYADRVLAVALDDDQGAYIDNQTWPAPHLQAYLESLRGTVQSVTGPNVPTFVNTYQMKVTASSHVWAMGNWYQSDAYALGEHDRAQLEFSTGLLQTRPGQPLWTSEFQAGWLQQPQDVVPQGADPSNTILALGTMLQEGVRGVVDFPAQDTLAPAGYEAPFSNAFYAWDAALPYSPTSTVGARYGSTQRFGDIVRAYGPELAATHTLYDVTIAWLGSAFAPASMTNEDFGALADRTLETQRACRLAAITCRLIDLRYASDADLAGSKLVVLPRPFDGPLASRTFDPAITVRLARLVREGVPVANLVHRATLDASAIRSVLRSANRSPFLDAGLDASFAASNRDDGSGFLTIVNYATTPAHHAHPTITLPSGSRVTLPAIDVAARSTTVVPVDVPLRPFSSAFATGDRLLSSSCDVADLEPTHDGSLHIETRGDSKPCETSFRIAGRLRTMTAGVRAATLDTEGTLLAGGPSRLSPRPFSESVYPNSTTCRTITRRGVDICAGDPEHIPIRRDVLVAVEGLRQTVAPPSVIVNPDVFPPDLASVIVTDVFQDGFPSVIMQNDHLRVVVSPNAGGRSFVLEDLKHETSAFDSVGALRDDVAIQPPLSTSDRIARYTHQFPAGFFNRAYDVKIVESGERAVVTFSYTAPDAFPNGATFTRTLTLEPHSRDLIVDETATFANGTTPDQHGVSITSLAVGDPRQPTTQHVLPEGSTFADPIASASSSPSPSSTPATAASPFASSAPLAPLTASGLFDDKTHEAILVVTDHGLRRELQPSATPHTLVVTADIARAGTTRTIFRYDFPADLAGARAELADLQKLLADPRDSAKR